MIHRHPCRTKYTKVFPDLVKNLKRIGRQPVILNIADFAVKQLDVNLESIRFRMADTKYPIVVLQEGDRLRLIDGRHRLVKLIERGETEINAYIVTWEDISPFTYYDNRPSTLMKTSVKSTS